MYKWKGIICMAGAKTRNQFCSMKKLLSLLVAGVFSATLIANPGYDPQQTNQHAVNGIAISGYDAVAYFTQQDAVKGDSAIQLDWNGATWYFSSKENRKLFAGNPEKYAPQYGGYCAYGASKGYKAKTDPIAWTVVGQKLYLNYNNQVKTIWLPDTSSRIQAADTYWKSLTNKN